MTARLSDFYGWAVRRLVERPAQNPEATAREIKAFREFIESKERTVRMGDVLIDKKESA